LQFFYTKIYELNLQSSQKANGQMSTIFLVIVTLKFSGFHSGKTQL